MKSRFRTFALASAFTAALGSSAAFADESESGGDLFERRVPAATSALEVAVGGGYSQGAGKVGGMANLEDLSSVGGGGEVKLGYRLIPNLAIGAYGTLASYAEGDQAKDHTVVGGAAGLYADLHLRPRHAVDPWVELSTGWRGLWLTRDGEKTTSLQGLELARLQVGIDYRITPQIAIAPVIGASVTMFVSQDSPATMDFTEIADKHADVYFFSGLQGRFSLFGKTVD